MKVRQGFVSNSSSNSFVALGIDLDDHPKLKKKYYDDEDYSGEPKNADELPEDTLCEYYEGCGTILGWILGSGSSDDGSFDVDEVEMTDLVKYAEAFEKATGVKPKLMGGVYAS